MPIDQNQLRLAAQWVRTAQAMIVTAGAGMGVDSGLPDFRGEEGFWRAYPALRAEAMTFYDIASPSSFKGELARTAWGFYGHRLAMYRRVKPNAGFDILRSWADRMPQGAWVFTSNVDGHFQRAGFKAEQVHECHGSIHRMQCLTPCCEALWSADGFEPEIDESRCRLTNELPTCPSCGGMARPNILMFEDYGWLEASTEASRARLDAWRRQVSEVLVIELGAGTEIPTVRRFGERVAKRFIRINPGKWGARGGANSMGIEGPALEVLAAIDREMQVNGS
ncbi:Sir2 family NAD-dependent protein deacetylase [Cupriavidus sp. DL-D2]|jgi:NAD-dependent SIR2 family protein deacetylase|uniref:SIR2 family NAD-dependent protein deacylase n=1 Tax=Cupriavidus sp. DL-D2 TaxID=3144974 RepID=UPI0032148314